MPPYKYWASLSLAPQHNKRANWLMLMGSSYAAGETVMCPERESSRTRRGGKKSAAAEQKANKQPQRGLGVAQLEKIRLHNQMMAAYRSSGVHQQDGARVMQQVPFAAPGAELMAGSSPFQQSYHHTAATDRGIVGVQYYGNLQPYSTSPPPPTLFAHDVRDSSGQRLGQGTHPPPPQHFYWVTTSNESGSHEELDLELRL